MKKAIYGWTDYPITELGDEPYTKAPQRNIKVISYDGDKYAVIDVAGIRTSIKGGYCYEGSVKNKKFTEGGFDSYHYKCFSYNKLRQLPNNNFYHYDRM